MKVKIVNKTEFNLPKYETNGSVGMDLRANIKEENTLTLKPRVQYLVPTGIFIELPNPTIEKFSGEGWGYEAQIRPRSGLAAKKGITIVNAPGTCDPDYRGEIKIIMMNLTDVPYIISHGDRIAQMVISRFERISWLEVDKLEESNRGSGGFGSTGSN